MQTVKIRIINEVYAVVVGLEDSDHHQLYEMYGIFAPGYIFNPKYKLGQWDGKIRFFQQTGKTYLYLIEQIVPHLVRWGYKIEVEDLRKSVWYDIPLIDENVFAHVIHPYTKQPIILRDYQVNCVNQILLHGNGVISACTGAGKTLMCAALCYAYGLKGLRTLTIVPTGDLIDQTKSDYVNCQLDVGEYSGGEKTVERQHVVSTWQALQHNPRIVTMFDVVIVDECHGLTGNVLTKLLTESASQLAYRIGFTGTIPKDQTEELAVHVAVGPKRCTVEAHELIERGYLARPSIDIIQLQEDLTQQYDQYVKEQQEMSQSTGFMMQQPTYTEFKKDYFVDFSSEKTYLQHNTCRIEWIAQYITLKGDQKKGNVLCLVDNIAYGRKLAQLIPGAIFVNGQDVKKKKERKDIYNMFDEHDNLIVIATVHIAGTGLSINRIFNLILLDIGKSFRLTIQAIGRGLRTANDKDTVDITDICSDLKYGKKHTKERVKFYKEAHYPHKLHKIKYQPDID